MYMYMYIIFCKLLLLPLLHLLHVHILLPTHLRPLCCSFYTARFRTFHIRYYYYMYNLVVVLHYIILFWQHFIIAHFPATPVPLRYPKL